MLREEEPINFGTLSLISAEWDLTYDEIPLLNAEIESDYEPNSVLQQAFRMRGVAAGGTKFKTDGIVFTVCPTKIAMRGGVTLVNEGVAEFHHEGRTGFGIAEYWVAVKRDQA